MTPFMILVHFWRAECCDARDALFIVAIILLAVATVLSLISFFQNT